MPALKPAGSAGWPKGGQARKGMTPWQGVERAMGAKNYSKQAVGGCASRGLGSTPERDGPWKMAAREVENSMPAHAMATARTIAEMQSLQAATSFDLYGDKENA